MLVYITNFCCFSVKLGLTTRALEFSVSPLLRRLVVHLNVHQRDRDNLDSTISVFHGQCRSSKFENDLNYNYSSFHCPFELWTSSSTGRMEDVAQYFSKSWRFVFLEKLRHPGKPVWCCLAQTKGDWWHLKTERCVLKPRWT